MEDVRTVLDFYRQEDDIVEAFKRNQARLREEEAKRAELQQQQGAQGQWSGMFSRGLFGRSAAKSVSHLMTISVSFSFLDSSLLSTQYTSDDVMMIIWLLVFVSCR